MSLLFVLERYFLSRFYRDFQAVLRRWIGAIVARGICAEWVVCAVEIKHVLIDIVFVPVIMVVVVPGDVEVAPRSIGFFALGGILERNK